MNSARRKRYQQTLFAYQDGKCAYCMQQMMLPVPCNNEINRTTKNLATLDHLVPRCKNGRWKWDNLVLACAKCNNEDRNRGELILKIKPLAHLTGKRND